MVYRGWNITTFSTYLGYLVQYVSPFGEAHSTSPCFPSGAQAVAYAQASIDQWLQCERSHFAPAVPAAPVCKA